MKVQELLVSIKRKDFNMEKELQVKAYLPIEVKKTIAQGIIYESTEDENGFIKVDSVQQYMSYVKYMITMHTNLDYNEKEDYDKLCSTMYGEDSLLNAIFGCFSDDAKECTRIMKLMVEDYMQENSMEYIVVKFLANIGTKVEGIANAINSKVGEINLDAAVPDNVDLNKLGKFLGEYVK